MTNNLYHVLLSLKRGTVSARNITLLIDNCVNYYCGLLFSKRRNKLWFSLKYSTELNKENNGMHLIEKAHMYL